MFGLGTLLCKEYLVSLRNRFRFSLRWLLLLPVFVGSLLAWDLKPLFDYRRSKTIIHETVSIGMNIEGARDALRAKGLIVSDKYCPTIKEGLLLD